MNYIVDPTLHIIDTERDFFITTKNMNLKLVLNDAQKQRVYDFLDKIKKKQNIEEFIVDSKQFERKFLNILISKGLVKKDFVEESLFNHLPFNAIHAPAEFNTIINEQFESTIVYKEEEQSSYLFIEDNNALPNEIYIYIYEDCFYLTTKKINLEPVNLCPIHIQHAAYVFLDKVKNYKFNSLDEEILKVDLSIYTNEIQTIKTTNINEENFLQSLFVDSRLSGNSIYFDMEQFFPLIQIQYQLSPGEERIYSFGFDQHDALRNLLYVLEERGLISGRESVYNHEFKLNNDSFFKKYMSIYFDQNDIQFNYLVNGKEMVCNGQVFTVKNSNCCENSLLLSIFYNRIYGKKEVSVS